MIYFFLFLYKNVVRVDTYLHTLSLETLGGQLLNMAVSIYYNNLIPTYTLMSFVYIVFILCYNLPK